MEPVGGGAVGWIGIVVGLVIGALVVVAAIVGYVSSIANDVQHPVEVRRAFCLYQCDRATFRIRNDTGTSILLARCDGHCGADDDLDRPSDLAPGETIRVHAIGIPGAHDWYAADRETGARLGCVVLDEDVSYHGIWDVELSAARPCRAGTASTPARHVAA